MAVIDAVEVAIEDGSFQEILDKNDRDWPLCEALESMLLGLKCAQLQCGDRSNLRDSKPLMLLKPDMSERKLMLCSHITFFPIL